MLSFFSKYFLAFLWKQGLLSDVSPLRERVSGIGVCAVWVRSPSNPAFFCPRDSRRLLPFPTGLSGRAQRHCAVRCWGRGRWWCTLLLPLPLVFLSISWRLFLVPAVRPVAADNPDIQVFISKANTKMEKIIFNSAYNLDLTFRRQPIPLSQVFSFYCMTKSYRNQEPKLDFQHGTHLSKKHQAT